MRMRKISIGKQKTKKTQQQQRSFKTRMEEKSKRSDFFFLVFVRRKHLMTVQIISIEFNENGNFAVVVVALVHSPILCFRQWWFFVVSYFKPFMTKTLVFSVCVCVCVQQNEFRVQLRVQIQFLPKIFPSSIRNWRYDSWNLSR